MFLQVLTALYLHQAVMLALLSLKAFPWVPLLLPAVIATALFHSAAAQLLERPSSVTALQDARRLDELEAQLQGRQGQQQAPEQCLQRQGVGAGSVAGALKSRAEAADGAHGSAGEDDAPLVRDQGSGESQDLGGAVPPWRGGGSDGSGAAGDGAAAGVAQQLYLSPAFQPRAAEVAALLAEVEVVRSRLASRRGAAVGSAR